MKRIQYCLFLTFALMDIGLIHAKTVADSLDLPAGFAINSVLQSSMVIQQGQPLLLWGTGQPDQNIEIQADWDSEIVTVKVGPDGKWSGEIMVPEATPGNFTKYNLQITHGSEKINLSDLLIGEVWLCSGQSNMDMQMEADLPWLEGVIDYENEIAAADYPEIRFINIEKKFTKEPIQEAKGTWQQVSPQTAGKLSGVAYYFGRELHQSLQVPIGLVISSFGGSAAQAWTSRESLGSHSDLKTSYLDPYDNSNKPKESLDSVGTLEEMFEILTRPTLLYNAMISPIKNLSVKGFLWYQGESNKLDGPLYTQLSAAMIEGWRKEFPGEQHPFYFVQMPAYNWEENDSTATYYALFREAQEAILETVANTGMIGTMDIGEVDNIHPRNKKDVGVRLSKLALNQTYNFKEIVYLGPRFSSYQVKGNTLMVEFERESIGGGLTTSDGGSPKHFYVAGEDRVFFPAEAKIVNHQVLLKSDQVKSPIAVRYAFTNYPISNFQNEEGLPAFPFRSDQWAE